MVGENMLVGYARVSTDDQNLEFERNLTRERTQAGFQAARARGRKGGRPKALNKDKQALAVQLYDERKHTVAQICELMGVSRPTLYKYIDAKRNRTKLVMEST